MFAAGVDFDVVCYIIESSIIKAFFQKLFRGPAAMATVVGPRIVDVAEQIAADIRRRKLRPGDPYPGTAVTARRLKVSGSTVNRAFQLLAQRGVVERRQRRGTIVADPGPRRADTTLHRVHLVVREDHLRAEGLWADGVLWGLQGVLPGVELQFNFRPEVDEAEYVEQLIRDILSSRQTAGLVLIRSTVVTQRLVVDSGLPAVVSGTLQPSVTNLPSIDRDQRQIGVLLAQHLLDSGCRKFVLLMRERVVAGDHQAIDGALATLAAAGISLGDVQLRCLPSDEAAIAAAAEGLFAEERNRVGCLCRSATLARGVSTAIERLRLPAKRRPLLAVADAAGRTPDEVPYPCIESQIPAEEYGATLGQMLAAAARGEKPDPYHVVVPVRLK
jgi:hypothetical protein